MLLAVLSDLHGNLSALRAVRDELDRLASDLVVVLGDLVGYLTRPNRVVAEVERTGWPCLAGNYDLAVLAGGRAGIDQFLKPGIGPEPRAVFAWTEARVTAGTRRFLASLPSRLELDKGGRRILACHGSPRQVREYLYPDHPLEDLDEMMIQEGVDLLLCGHTHRPFVRPTAAGLAVNPGSVGKPKDGDPRAALALVEIGETFNARIVRVDYDLAEEARLLEENGLPPATVQRLYAGT